MLLGVEVPASMRRAMYTSTSSRPAVGLIGMSGLAWLAPILGALLAGGTFAWVAGETHTDSGIDGFTEDGGTAAVDSMGGARLDC
jgi:aquaporin Z